MSHCTIPGIEQLRGDTGTSGQMRGTVLDPLHEAGGKDGGAGDDG